MKHAKFNWNPAYSYLHMLTSTIHRNNLHTVCFGDVLHFFKFDSSQKQSPNVVTETVRVQLARLVKLYDTITMNFVGIATGKTNEIVTRKWV